MVARNTLKIITTNEQTKTKKHVVLKLHVSAVMTSRAPAVTSRRARTDGWEMAGGLLVRAAAVDECADGRTTERYNNTSVVPFVFFSQTSKRHGIGDAWPIARTLLAGAPSDRSIEPISCHTHTHTDKHARTGVEHAAKKAANSSIARRQAIRINFRWRYKRRTCLN